MIKDTYEEQKDSKKKKGKGNKEENLRNAVNANEEIREDKSHSKPIEQLEKELGTNVQTVRKVSKS